MIDRVPESDAQILTFASVHRIVALDQVKVLLRDREDEASERLEALAGAGLLRRDRAARAMPGVFRITRAGLAMLGGDLVAPSFSERWRHDIGVGWVWLAATAGRFGGFDRLFTEREMRARDGDRAQVFGGTGGEPPFAVRLSGDHS